MRIDKNFVALVTGGASGLGLGAVKQLSQLGASVIIADLNEQSGKKISEDISNVQFFKTDVSQEQSIISLFAYIQQKYKKLNLIVQCAGIFSYSHILAPEFTTQEFEKVFGVNIVGSFNIAKHGAKFMIENTEEVEGEKGLIIFTSSLAATDGDTGTVAYSASKGAINGITLPLTRQLSKHKIRVMTIAPGYMVTPMTSFLPEQSSKKLSEKVPLKRGGTPKDYAQMVCSIVQNPFLCGDIWRLDGGLRG